MPQAINSGKLRIRFVDNFIHTISTLRKREELSDKVWRKMKYSIEKIDNLEVRTKLQKIK